MTSARNPVPNPSSQRGRDQRTRRREPVAHEPRNPRSHAGLKENLDETQNTITVTKRVNGEPDTPRITLPPFSESLQARQAESRASEIARVERAGLMFVPGDKADPEDKSKRAPGGRFGAGNGGGPGNPYAKQVGALRRAMLESVTPAEIQALMKVLLKQAKSGDVRAIKEILDRTLGKAEGLDLLAKVEELEAAVVQGRDGAAKPQ